MSEQPFNPKAARQTVIADTLRRCRLFSDLAPKDLSSIAEVCVLKHYGKGETVFREGETADGFYIVQTGSVNVHRVTPDGKEQVIAIFRPVDSFAEVTLTTVDTYPADAIALEPTQLILVQKQQFVDRIKRHPDLALRMLTSMSLHLKYLVQMIEDLKFKQVEARLAHWLLRNRPPRDTSPQPVISLRMSKRVLASQLGVTSETLSRTLGRFRDQGVIQVDGANIQLLDVGALDELVRKAG